MKKLLSAALISSALLLTGCGDKEAADQAAPSPININLSLVFAPSELLTQELIKVTDSIREKTDGGVNIQVFPSGQLPVYKDNLEQVVNGANWIAVEDLTYLGDYVPDFTALAGPMLYQTYDEYLAIMQTDLVSDLKQQMLDKGVKVLNTDYIFGFRHMMTNREIVEPEDMRGMRIRVPGSQLFISTLSAMGGAPAALPFPETYAGVQQGVVDGLEGTILTMYSNKMYEVTKNLSLTKHFLGTVGVYISPKVWERFSPEQQAIVMEEFEKGALSNNTELVRLDAEYAEKLQQLGVTINEVNSEAFNKLTQPVYSQFPAWSPDIYSRIEAELEKIRAQQ
ncbi:TRAP transporter substrate-binding protein DctP [Vibrio metschnikovii]|nr:TRAP transporter substrate-binding protein DctP [Vibrio metschnikovii]EKO3646460.1 TRAP transporter substrate-binding protein DctP [Vibrio metschnikovii]EKO3672680.1 TRAP transporter substrate-binding protein DctP [Vibrio metschnikovii]